MNLALLVRVLPIRGVSKTAKAAKNAKNANIFFCR